MQPLRIAHVAPVATSVPPKRSGSVQTITSLLTEGLVARGHDVTLFAPGDSTTSARLHALDPEGYWNDLTMWPWELHEMMNIAAAVERANDFDLIHYQVGAYPIALPFTRLSPVPIVQTLHHNPSEGSVALWRRYPEAPLIAISRDQASRLTGLNVAGIVMHSVDTARFVFREEPDDYLLFLGRFTAGKGVLQAIEVARRTNMRLLLAAEDVPYYREHVAHLVDGKQIVYVGEADFSTKVALLGGARALLYPVQVPEPFGLVLVEAMACGTPVAAFRCGAAADVVEQHVTGVLFDDTDAMVRGLEQVLALDRRGVRERAVRRFRVDRMVDEYVTIYRNIVATHQKTSR